ncbi:putative integral membrane protein [metagenome]|uniref:Putative integral membrane protein n=1 Tax=metagenome TaxID=256318 RepID=A0A2P2BZP9_9ZZZZ
MCGMPDAPRRRRWQSRLGWLLIVCGLSLIAYVGWQLYGTNIVSARKHREITTSLEQQWEAGKDLATVDSMKADALLRVPRFGKDYAVPILQGTADDVLAAGVGHFTETASVGEVGNYALAGHRVTHGEPFRNLPDLEVGDEIVIETRSTIYTYVLDTAGDALVVPFTGTWVLEPLPRNPDGGVQPRQREGQRLITLTTCSEIFHTDNRMIAFGHLESTERK